MKCYGKEVAKAIIFGYRLDHKSPTLEVRDSGVWPTVTDDEVLMWKPVCELDGPDAVDPLAAPSLPIPFSVNELAAFMLDGAGAIVSSAYGPWNGGPDEEVLQGLGVLGGKAREALRAAYAAYRTAEGIVPPLKLVSEKQGRRSAAELNDAEMNRWRKAMVRHFLAPTGASTASSVGIDTVANGWILIKPKRLQGYGTQLYSLLKMAKASNEQCPKATDILEIWRTNVPVGFHSVDATEVIYYDTKGNTKTANLEAIRKAVKRMTGRQAPDSAD